MKRGVLLTLLMTLLMVVVVSCGGTPKELKLPNKSVKYENGAITYKGKPYTGKIVTSLADKVSGYDGFITLKEGHLEGQTKINSGKNKEEYEVNVKDGKFDGQYIAKTPQMGEITITSEAGVLKAMKSNMINGLKQDLTFDAAGLANGTMEMGSQKFTFKDGKSPVAGQANAFVSLKYIKETNSVSTEVTQGGNVVQKENNPLGFDVKTLESQVFPALVGN